MKDLMKRIVAGVIISAVASNISFAIAAGPVNGISKEMLGRLKASYGKDAGNKAIRNALAGN